MQSALRLGAKGIKVSVSGRLGGNEIARTEWLRDGSIPSHTLRADIDFGIAVAKTTVGLIGVKVWVYKGDIVTSKKLRQEKISAEAALASGSGASTRVKPVKSRIEAAVGETKEGKILEAGGGSKVEETKKTTNLVEAGGGRKINPLAAQESFDEEKKILEEE